MDNLISLLGFAVQQGIEVDWFSMKCAESLSMPLPDGKFGIAIDPEKIQSDADEFCKLAHEVGHCVTGAFYNRYSSFDLREKHEHRADKWAVERAIDPDALDAAIVAGYTEFWQLAEYFNVTEDFMRKAVCWYTYGNLATELYF